MFIVSADGAVVVGASAGGIEALRIVLGAVPKKFVAPIFVVQHFPSDATMFLPSLLASECRLPVVEAVDKASIEGGRIYVAPPGYHLLIEKDHTMSLSADELVNWARPSIDVLFESASRVYKELLVGILLTGANRDGAIGLKTIKKYGGYNIVQDPKTAEAAAMPNAALEATPVDFVASLQGIGQLFGNSLVGAHE